MTDIEQKALALLNEALALKISVFSRAQSGIHEALCRAIEQHEAFRQEVSDAVEDYLSDRTTSETLGRFIIAKPDPLVEVFDECFHQEVREGETWSEAMARKFRAVIEKFEGKIVWGEG